ncbi:MAG: molybdopterin-dependent oxidoreductase [Ardenticatenaceae bacterium]|nr:molybdopterin-dependent oxidoreductase [Ardenticatenaceae bacterium]
MKATVFRFTNVAILASILTLTLTGLYSFIWVSGGWIVEIHRIAAWALLALIPWKVGISWRSLRRGLGKRADRNIVVVISMLLATLAVTAVILALLWTWQIGSQTAWGQLLLWWHWILALVLLVPFAVHVWRRWPRPKRTDFTSRRAALRLIGLGAVGLVGWRLAETLAAFRVTAESPRRITGSRQRGAFSGNDFPITSEPSPTIDTEKWRLKVGGAVSKPFELTKIELAAYSYQEMEATLDCTNGWWTVQNWGGIMLDTLLAQAEVNATAIAIRLTSVTGYSQVFTLEEAQQILVGTHVGGEPLSRWHGAPARAVVPSRRGTFWVKWLSEIVVLDSIGQILAHPISIR